MIEIAFGEDSTSTELERVLVLATLEVADAAMRSGRAALLTESDLSMVLTRHLLHRYMGNAHGEENVSRASRMLDKAASNLGRLVAAGQSIS